MRPRSPGFTAAARIRPGRAAGQREDRVRAPDRDQVHEAHDVVNGRSAGQPSCRGGSAIGADHYGAWTVAGISLSVPRTLFHTISFIRSIGIRSGFEKSTVSDSAAISELTVFVAVNEEPAVIAVCGRRFGTLPKAAVIRVAAVSNWLIGRTPSSSCMVCSTETVE